MKEILEFRSQIYLPSLPEKSDNLSGVELIDYREEDPTLPELLITYHLRAEQEFDPKLISQLIRDVFHDFFFKKEMFSSVQIVEEAILDVKNKILKLLKSRDKNYLEFNFICGIFEENSISFVRYGNTHAHVFRDGSIKELNFSNEGYFGTSKGRIKSGDLFILSTDLFFQKFVNEDLVKKGLKINNDSLDSGSASLILYFNKIVVEGKTLPSIAAKKIKKKVQKNILKYQGILIFLAAIGLIYTAFTGYQSVENHKLYQEQSKLRSSAQEVLGSSVENPDQYSLELLEEISKIGKSTLVDKDQIISNLTLRYNEINNIEEKKYSLLFDFKEINPRADISSMTIYGNTIYVLDKDSSKIYSSNLNNLQFNSKELVSSKPLDLDIVSRTLVIRNEESLSFYTLDLNKDGSDLPVKVGKNYVGFSTFIYEISDGKINKLDINADKPEKVLWAEGNEILNARAIDLDYDLYTLDQNSQLIRYAKGKKVDVKFENSRFKFENMYIDRSLGRNYFSFENKFYLFSLEGNFEKQILDTSFIGKIEDFIVFPKKIIFISNSKLYELTL